MTESRIIERATAALTKTLRDQGVELQPVDVRNLVIDVLQAIHEPSERMTAATWIKTNGCCILTKDQAKLAAADAWRSMIDAALIEASGD